MFGSDDDTLPEWKRLATEFGALHDQTQQIRLHAEHCGELRAERKTELSLTLPTVRLFDGYGECLWWFDVGEGSADEFLKLVDAAGNLMSHTKSQMKMVTDGQWTRVEQGLRELSPTAQWFRELFGEARTAGDTEATPRGDCLLDAIKSSQLVCSERSDSSPAFPKLKQRIEDEHTVQTWRKRNAPSRLDYDSLDDWYPKPRPDITAVQPSVPFVRIADELWQCWKAVLYGVEARLLRLKTDTKRADWLSSTYRPELCGCLKRVYAALPYDADFADCSPQHRQALRKLNRLVNRLWLEYMPYDNRNPDRILAQLDEAHFGELVATFDRIRLQVETSAPIDATEAKLEPSKLVELPPGTMAGDNGSKGKQPIEAEYVFKRDGDGYLIKGCINGHRESGHFASKGAKGLDVLFQLVQTPGVPVPMLNLIVGVGMERAKGDGQSPQPVADAQALKDIRAEGRQLLIDIETAESEMERNELQQKLSNLEATTKGMMGIKGNPRDLNNPNDGFRSTIHKQLNRIYDKLGESMPQLVGHFRLSCGASGGDGFVYAPAGLNITWDTGAE